MAETAAHLLDHVIPRVPVRQLVLSFPIPLLHLFSSNPDLLSPVVQVITRALSTFIINAGFTPLSARRASFPRMRKTTTTSRKVVMLCCGASKYNPLFALPGCESCVLVAAILSAQGIVGSP